LWRCPASSRINPEPKTPPPMPAVKVDDSDHPHILVIADNEDTARTLTAHLTDNQYRVTHAATSAHGVQMARSLQPDIITVDVLMQQANGWSVVEKLSQHPATAHIPVIVVSVVDDQPLSVSTSVAAHISKPIERDTLLQTIKRLEKDQTYLDAPVLIVDDDSSARELIAEVLASADYPVAMCSNGQDALDWLDENTASLLVLDLMMPGMSGFEVLSTIREMPDLVNLPVLIVSAKELTFEEKDFLDAHIVDVIKKRGLKRNDLLTRIKQALPAP
jgi:CheY-like chemotaxis protein